MARYGIIVTEKVERTDLPIHWLKKGTVVEILPEGEVLCVVQCLRIDIVELEFKKHRQFVNPEDVIELATDQLEALRAVVD